MKKYIYTLLTCCLLVSLSGCNDFLELKTLEKVSGEQLLGSEGGLNTLLASMYNAMPVEGAQALTGFMKDFEVKNG